MVNNSTNISKKTITSDLKSVNMKKTTTYNVGNPGCGMIQTQTYSWVNPRQDTDTNIQLG
jgi:hypothetical protein